MGRGSSPLSGGGGGNSLDALTKGHFVEGSPGQYTKEAASVIQGVQDVLKDFGMEDNLRAIRYSNTTIRGAETDAAMNGVGDLIISPKYLSKGENKNSNVVSDTFYGTGAHEAGHAVVNGLLRKVPIEGDAKSENLKIATARSKGKLEHAILKEAKRRNGGQNPPISKYGSTKEIEKVAEAVSDVYSNKGKANPYSKVIVGVMKDINSGTFNPKLKVSRREMGI